MQEQMKARVVMEEMMEVMQDLAETNPTIKTIVEDLENGGIQKALTAYFTMVALDKKGRPHRIPELVLETEDDRIAFEQGAKRYETYKQRKHKQSK